MSDGRRGGRRRAIAALIALVALSTGLVGCGSNKPSAHVVIRVTPKTTLNDQPVDITISGLAPHQLATLTVSAHDSHDVNWESRAAFKANGRGVVSLNHASPLSGTYRDIHGVDLVAGMQPIKGETTGAPFSWEGAHPIPFTLTVRVGTQVVARSIFDRVGQSRGVTSTNESVSRTGFYGQMSWPKRGTERHAAILEFDGSDGGLTEQLQATALASAGYPTLDLAYFQEPGLPSNLSRIPLSYFAKALRWLAKQPGVNPRRIWVMGTSRGGEAALLLGAHYPKLVYGVVANVAASVSVCSLPDCNGPAWTYKGKPVPHADSPYDETPDSLLPVAHIQAPVVLDCGTDDREWRPWNDCGMAAANMSRLAHDRSPHQLYRFVGGGHGLSDLVPYEPYPPSFIANGNLGGVNAIANSNADAVLWPRLLAFLARPARTGTYTFNAG